MPASNKYVMQDQIQNQVWKIMNINLARLEYLESSVLQRYWTVLLAPNPARLMIKQGGKTTTIWKQVWMEIQSAYNALGRDLKDAIL